MHFLGHKQLFWLEQVLKKLAFRKVKILLSSEIKKFFWCSVADLWIKKWPVERPFIFDKY